MTEGSFEACVFVLNDKVLSEFVVPRVLEVFDSADLFLFSWCNPTSGSSLSLDEMDNLLVKLVLRGSILLLDFLPRTQLLDCTFSACKLIFALSLAFSTCLELDEIATLASFE
jgi:hypothetical protein